MSFLNSKQPVSSIPQQLNSINVDRSRYGDPVPIVYGMQRIPITLLWYGAFTTIPQSSKGSGKGGGGSQITSYNYTASCVMGLCEGPVTAINQIWKDKSITTASAEGLTVFLGAGGQATWSYLTTNFPAQAVPYDHTAYLGAPNISLGSSAAVPNYTFEVQGFLSSPGAAITFTGSLSAGATGGTLTSSVTNGVYDITFSDKETRSCTISGGTTVVWDSAFGLTNACTASAVLGGYDAEPSAIILDYCTDVNHGCGFANVSSAIQGAGNTYQTYCKANSLFISPWEDTQRTANSFLTDILEITNSNAVMSAGVLNIYPYADAAVTGNGVTYTPNLTPLFAFSDDDYLPASEGSGGSSSNSDDPVQVTRKPLTETYNVVTVEFFDRSNSYNTALAEWKDPLDIAVNGIRAMGVKTFHQITVASVALQVASLIGQRQLYVRNQYVFSVRADLYSLLEPMDLVSITDSGLGLSNKLVRVIQIDDDANDVFTITAEDMLVGTASAPRYNITAAQGYYANYAVLPPNVATPVVFSCPPALISGSGGYQLWCAVGPTTPTGTQTDSYGGCNVFASLDDLTWSFAGTISGSARFGTVTTGHAVGASDTTIYLTMNPETNTDGYQLNSASASDFANNRSLIWLDGEIVAYETITVVGSGLYTATVTRGLFGTTAVTHAVGASWALLDETVFKFDFDPGMIGETIHFKFYSFNSIGRQAQTTATDYPYAIADYGTSQLIAGPLTLLSKGVTVVGHSAFKSGGSPGSWDSNVYSAQAYTNGAFVSFSPSQTNLAFMVGLDSAPTAGNSYTVLDYAFYCLSTGALGIYESGTSVGTFGTYAAGDVLTVTYDGAFVRYLQNGTLLHQTPAAGGKTLYLDSSFADAQAAVDNIEFGPYGTATPVMFIARGACLVGDSYAVKLGGASAWDSDVYSVNGYKTCNLVFKPNTNTGYLMIGFVNAPNPNYATSGYVGLLYAFECASTGSWGIYESGSPVSGPGGSYTSATRFSMTYDGSTVTYYVDGVSVRTVSTSGQTFYLDSSFYTPGGGVNSLDFGPGSLVPILDTSVINFNAATDVAVATGSTVNGTTITASGSYTQHLTTAVSYTNPTTGPVLVEINYTIAGYIQTGGLGSSGASLNYAEWYWSGTDNGGAIQESLSSTTGYTIPDQTANYTPTSNPGFNRSGSGGAIQMNKTKVDYYALAAGHTLNVQLSITLNVAAAGSTNTELPVIDEYTLRLAIIKR
jgi:Putative phage tail protein